MIWSEGAKCRSNLKIVFCSMPETVARCALVCNQLMGKKGFIDLLLLVVLLFLTYFKSTDFRIWNARKDRPRCVVNDSLFYSECFVDEAEEGPLKVNTLNGSVAIWAFLTASRLFSRFFASKAVASGSTAFLRGSRVHCFVLSLPRAPPTVENSDPSDSPRGTLYSSISIVQLRF